MVYIAETKEISFNVSWQLFERFLGKGTCSYEWSKEQRHNPYSIAYCCPACGCIWARIEVLEVKTKWNFQRRACPAHGFGYLMPSNDQDPKMLSAPEEVLKREIMIYTNQLSGENPSTDYSWDLVLDGI